ETRTGLCSIPTAVFSGNTAAVFVSGPFHFLQGQAELGANLSLQGVPAIGRIALFLKDSQNQLYALTCAHVLEGDPAHHPPLEVDSQGGRIGALTHRVDIIFGCTNGAAVHANEVDCALAQLDDQIEGINSLPAAASLEFCTFTPFL